MEKRLEYYAHLVICSLGGVLLVYLAYKYALSVLLPFVIAWCVAEGTRPLARRVSEGTGASERVVSALFSIVIVLGLLAAMIGIIVYALGEAWTLLRELISGGALTEALDRIFSFLPNGGEGGELGAYIKNAVSGALTGLLSSVGSAVTLFASGLPRVLFFILVTVCATLYFSLDLDRINGFINGIMPKGVRGWVLSNKKSIKSSLLKYLRAYLLIMLITFMEMLFGFLVIGIDYAVLLAFAVAILDALPLIGVGTVLIPIAIFNFAVGKGALGIGLLLIFAIHSVIRQVIEPRIVGKNLGIHPVLSLFLIYLGYVLFGALGILLVPVVSVLINAFINKDDSSEIGERTVGK
jgi:sporulation integral membrane protein YtvI